LSESLWSTVITQNLRNNTAPKLVNKFKSCLHSSTHRW
jgi:hypothetical protein